MWKISCESRCSCCTPFSRPTLASTIEISKEIGPGTEEEVELRACSIHAVEKMRELISIKSGRRVCLILSLSLADSLSSRERHSEDYCAMYDLCGKRSDGKVLNCPYGSPAVKRKCNRKYINASMISNSLSPCMGFLTNSSGTGTSPTAECCSFIKSLTSGGKDCLCLLVTGNVPFSIPIKRTLAISLPRACNMPGVPLQCKTSGSPLAAPASFGPTLSPASTPSLSPQGTYRQPGLKLYLVEDQFTCFRYSKNCHG